MLWRWAWTASRPSPPKERQIRSAKSGIESPLGELPSVLVTGGVATRTGVPVAPSNFWNAVGLGSERERVFVTATLTVWSDTIVAEAETGE
jgi:hypothetical protein